MHFVNYVSQSKRIISRKEGKTQRKDKKEIVVISNFLIARKPIANLSEQQTTQL